MSRKHAAQHGAPFSSARTQSTGDRAAGRTLFFFDNTQKISQPHVVVLFFFLFLKCSIFLGLQTFAGDERATASKSRQPARSVCTFSKDYKQPKRKRISSAVAVVRATGPHASVAPAFARLFVRPGASVATWPCVGSTGPAIESRTARVVVGFHAVLCGRGGVERRGKDVAKGRDISARVVGLAGVVVI
nr:hypothetical protein [Pandoravirus belohorizontensis]